jgi:pyridoxamine 5'-phosphate oxidase
MAQVAEVAARFAGREVPRPPYWGGYRLSPDRIEFWINGEHRLHDRFVYERSGEGWRVTRLSP